MTPHAADRDPHSSRSTRPPADELGPSKDAPGRIFTGEVEIRNKDRPGQIVYGQGTQIGWVGNLRFQFVSILDLRVGDRVKFRVCGDIAGATEAEIVDVLPRAARAPEAAADWPAEAPRVKRPRLESTAASASSAPSSAAPAAAKPLRGGAAPAAERPTPALTLTIKKVYLNQIFERRKRVEGRVHAGGLAKLRVGECVALRPGQFAKERCYVRVTRKRPFRSFREMLLECGVQACLPDARDLDEALAIYHSFPGFEEKAAESGVLALDVEPIVKSDGDGVLHLPDAARE